MLSRAGQETRDEDGEEGGWRQHGCLLDETPPQLDLKVKMLPFSFKTSRSRTN